MIETTRETHASSSADFRLGSSSSNDELSLLLDPDAPVRRTGWYSGFVPAETQPQKLREQIAYSSSSPAEQRGATRGRAPCVLRLMTADFRDLHDRQVRLLALEDRRVDADLR